VGSSTTVLAAVVTVAAVAACVAAASFGPVRTRAALFGIAAGAGFGLTASLMKLAVARLTQDGLPAFFTAWETYGLVAAGVGSVVLVQAALHAGTLVAAQPGITLADPVVSVVWGVLVIGETTREGPILVLAGLGAVTIGVAAMALGRALQQHELDDE
jgi:hypothetical protein